MKNVLDFLLDLSKGSVQLAERISIGTFEVGKGVTETTLHLTGNFLYGLSATFFFMEDWKSILESAGTNVLFSREEVGKKIEDSILDLQNVFADTVSSLHTARDFSEKFIYDNKGISSVIGSSHHDMIGFSDIKMSFRMHEKDVDPKTVWLDFMESGKEKIILLIPGLFCDETLWEGSVDKEAPAYSLGLVTLFDKMGYYPMFIRFNPGMHVSTNGKTLSEILSELNRYLGGYKLHTLAYSQGGLIFRSALYYGKEAGLSWVKNIGKTILVSSPDGGSYLEKIGFWIGFLFELSPNMALKIIGMIGNLRSDGIKDLSHGVIREEDWRESRQIRRYSKIHYYNELEDIDAYQVYSLFSSEESSFDALLGDGIIEKISIEILSDRVYRQKPNPESRVLKIIGRNHFSVLDAPEFIEKLKEIYREGS
jgi:pimeloyl-ACP methyl ester carboxylesterase